MSIHGIICYTITMVHLGFWIWGIIKSYQNNSTDEDIEEFGSRYFYLPYMLIYINFLWLAHVVLNG